MYCSSLRAGLLVVIVLLVNHMALVFLCTSWCFQSHSLFLGWCSFTQQVSFVHYSKPTTAGCIGVVVMSVHTCSYVCVHVCVCIHIYMCVCIHIYMCVCVCMHVCILVFGTCVSESSLCSQCPIAPPQSNIVIPSPSVSTSLILELGIIILERCSCL